MGKIKIIIFMTCLLSCLTLSQEKIKLLSETEKEYLAYKISTIQKQCDPNILNANKDVNGIYVFDREQIYKKYDSSVCNLLNYSDYIRKDNWLDPYINPSVYDIFGMSIYEIYYFPSKRYILGINDSGKVYLFEGFWQNDFQKFVAHYFNKIDNEEKAWNVAKFYYNIKFTFSYLTDCMTIEIVTKDNISNYSRYLDLIKPVEIIEANGGYKILFYVINKTTKAIDCENMFVDCQGNVNCKSENIREPDFYYK